MDAGVPLELRKLLSIRLTEENWPTIKAFVRGAGVPYSLETVRRAFNECPYKRLDTITLAIIMKHLNYAPAEIKAILSEHLPKGDEVTQTVLGLIGDQVTRELNQQEENLLTAFRKLIKKDPHIAGQLADYMNILAKGARVDIHKLTDSFRR